MDFADIKWVQLVAGAAALVMGVMALYHLGLSHERPASEFSSYLAWVWYKYAVPPLPLIVMGLGLYVISTSLPWGRGG